METVMEYLAGFLTCLGVWVFWKLVLEDFWDYFREGKKKPRD